MTKARDELVEFAIFDPEGDPILALAFEATRRAFRHNTNRMIRGDKGDPPGIREIVTELKDRIRSIERFATLAGLGDQAFYAEVIEIMVDRHLKLATGVKE